MKTEYKEIAGVPAIIIGERSEKVYLFVHGKMGNKEEALRFSEIACPAGFQVVGIDLPEQGLRRKTASVGSHTGAAARVPLSERRLARDPDTRKQHRSVVFNACGAG